ncbi:MULTISPECIES: hypothetical protein [Nostocales]|uniref:hypothetical protein n=1 Tax=Nostocales TaxID=1161 RepID=UPI001684CCDA|nr:MULTISPECIES: hypothetical protein [Nostocales]MBD2303884.1 hypothetical protein [Nostoc sp. FACHB-190]MBD2492546.1 hypothetical protein [Aulosira sp. FACHB-615]
MQIQPPPEKFLSTLLEIRNYYAPLVEEYGKLYREALDNLNHVEALLSNWPVTVEVNNNGFFREVAEEVFTVPAQESSNGNSVDVLKTATELSETQDNELSLVDNIKAEVFSTENQEDINSQLEETQLIVTAEEDVFSDDSFDSSQVETQTLEFTNTEKSAATTQEDNTAQESDIKDDSNDALTAASEIAQLDTTEPLPQEDEPPVAEFTKQEETTTTPDKSLYGQDIPMLEEYHSLRRIEAIEKLLQQHKGSVCHIDFVVRSLYGELEPKAWKVVKGRVQSTLTQGRESKKWSLVPGKPGYYTIDLKLLNNSRKGSSSKKSQTKEQKPGPQAQANLSNDSLSKPNQSQARKPSPQAKTNVIPMQGEFEGKFLIDAISLLLEQNPRRVFDVAEVVKQLYGELTPEQLQQVRPGVLNELSRGYRSGRFSRVPEEKGLYIWDSKLLPD